MALIKRTKEAISSFNWPELELWENDFILSMDENLLQQKTLPQNLEKRAPFHRSRSSNRLNFLQQNSTQGQIRFPAFQIGGNNFFAQNGSDAPANLCSAHNGAGAVD